MKTEKWIYRITNVCLVFLIFLYFVIILFQRNGWQIECVFYKYMHMYCPGCGGTRAFLSFMELKWGKSFCYHPFVPYSIILMLSFSASNSIEKISKGRFRIGMHFHDWYLYVGLAIILLNFLMKNVLLMQGIAMK